MLFRFVVIWIFLLPVLRFTLFSNVQINHNSWTSISSHDGVTGFRHILPSQTIRKCGKIIKYCLPLNNRWYAIVIPKKQEVSEINTWPLHGITFWVLLQEGNPKQSTAISLSWGDRDQKSGRLRWLKTVEQSFREEQHRRILQYLLNISPCMPRAKLYVNRQWMTGEL